MKPKLKRCLLWRDKTMKEFLTEQLNEELYKVYLELKTQEPELGVSEEKIFNEVYYQCTKLVYENRIDPDFEEISIDIKANVGTKLVSRVVFRLMYALLSARKGNSAEVRHIISGLEIYSFIAVKNSYFKEFVRSMKKIANRKFISLSPRPESANVVIHKSLDWNGITCGFDEEAILEVCRLWDDYKDEMMVFDTILEASKKAAQKPESGTAWRTAAIVKTIRDPKWQRISNNLARRDDCWMCAESLEPYNGFEDQLKEKDRIIEELKRVNAELQSANEELKSKLNGTKSKRQQERSFTLKMILDYIENHTNEQSVSLFVGMVNLFLRNAGDCTKEEMEMVDEVEHKVLSGNKGDYVSGSKNSFSDSAQLVNLTIPSAFTPEQIINIFPKMLEQLKNTGNG